jgi:hypothetical protein
VRPIKTVIVGHDCVRLIKTMIAGGLIKTMIAGGLIKTMIAGGRIKNELLEQLPRQIY